MACTSCKKSSLSPKPKSTSSTKYSSYNGKISTQTQQPKTVVFDGKIYYTKQ